MQQILYANQLNLGSYLTRSIHVIGKKTWLNIQCSRLLRFGYQTTGPWLICGVLDAAVCCGLWAVFLYLYRKNLRLLKKQIRSASIKKIVYVCTFRVWRRWQLLYQGDHAPLCPPLEGAIWFQELVWLLSESHAGVLHVALSCPHCAFCVWQYISPRGVLTHPRFGLYN